MSPRSHQHNSHLQRRIAWSGFYYFKVHSLCLVVSFFNYLCFRAWILDSDVVDQADKRVFPSLRTILRSSLTRLTFLRIQHQVLPCDDEELYKTASETMSYQSELMIYYNCLQAMFHPMSCRCTPGRTQRSRSWRDWWRRWILMLADAEPTLILLWCILTSEVRIPGVRPETLEQPLHLNRSDQNRWSANY